MNVTGLNKDKSTLVQVMAWCRQATSHYLSQCWPRSLSPYGVTRPQWVKMNAYFMGHTVLNYMNPGYFTLAAIYLKLQQIAHVSAHFRYSLGASVISTHIKTEGLYVKITIINQLKRLCIPDCAYTRAANQYGISVFCTDFTCKIREYEFGLENTEIELCQFCHLKYCCQNKAYLFWVANQSGFVAFYALEPPNTSLITKTFNLLSSTCSSSMLSCLTSCSCSTGSIH